MKRHSTFVSHWPDADASVLTLRGEYDANDVAELMQRASEALGSSARGLTIDLRRVTFIDSAMIGALLSCSRRLAEHDSRLAVLIDRESAVYRTLELTALGPKLSLFESRSEAATHLRNGSGQQLRR